MELPNDDLWQKLAPSLFIDHLFDWGSFLKICPDQLQQGKVLWIWGKNKLFSGF